MTDKPFSLSVKMMIFNDKGQVLLLKRSDNSSWNAGKYDLPGGKLDKGETFEEALIREVEEETSLKARIISLHASIEDRLPDFRVVHLIMKGSVEDGNIILSNEHSEHIWIKPEKVSNSDMCEYLANAIDNIKKDQGK